MAAFLVLLLAQSAYRLPWEEGKNFRCTQGNDGRLSHNGDARYAFDFSLPAGTKVCAARGGKVIEIKEDESEGGFEERFKTRSNFVKIDHADGTTGLYLHLQKDGALVDVGDTVLQGDVIALSGATGYVTTPHLHFQVNKGDSWESIPVAFADVAGNGVPTADGSYTSANPGVGPLKEEIWLLRRQTKLALQYGAYAFAWVRLKRLSEMKVKVKYEPVDGAKAELEALLKKGEAHADEIEKMPIDDAVRAWLLARRAWNGTPVEKRIDKISLQSKEGYAAAHARALATDKAQDAFLRGLKGEFEGKAPDLAYKEAVKAAPESDFGRWARERLKR